MYTNHPSWKCEALKDQIFIAFKNQNFSECINLCDMLIETQLSSDELLSDTSYEIFAKTFKWVSLQNIDDTDAAIKYFLEIDNIEIHNDIVLDDLWVYFLMWFIKSKLNVYKKREYNIENLFNTVKKGFEMFPNNESDFYDDLKSNLRLNIISKYMFFIERVFMNYWLEVIALRNESGEIKNFWLFNKETNKVLALFWFKRTNFYWDTFQDK